MTFLYHEDLKRLTVECPPTDYQPRGIPAYRFVSENINDPKNFQPLFFQDPRRVNDMEDVKKCQSMGLSFFDELEKAQVRFRRLKQQLGPRIYMTIGTHIAFANITEKDGVNSEVDVNGHFSNHPVTSCDYQNRFVIVRPL